MRIIVMSDSQGSTYNMKMLFTLQPDADMYIHLGDGCEDFERLACARGLPHASVRGNCDGYSQTPAQDVLTLDDKIFFITHGNRYGVKSSTEALVAAGREANADVILFGHTHMPLCEYIDDGAPGNKPFYLVNPGSISEPTEGIPTYTVIETLTSGILINTVNLY